jgi:DnaJ-domain-containing protein 1
METQTEQKLLPPPDNRGLLIKNFKIALGATVLVLAVVAGGTLAYNKFWPKSSVPVEPVHQAFLNEIFDLIKEFYWEDVTDEKLVELYVLATQKAANETFNPVPKTRDELKSKLKELLDKQESDLKRTELVSQIGDLVAANLQPFARSRLYSEKQAQELQNTLNNVNPDADQYTVLGVEKTATPEEIASAYQAQVAKVPNDNSAESNAKKQELQAAYDTLADEQNRQTYDQTKVQPTLTGRLITPEIYYIKMDRFSPTMVQELAEVTEKVDQGDQLDTLIFDLRGNIGGLIDGLPYILGPFIGPDQYAYQFFRKGNKQDFKTITGWMESLVRYKKVAVLIDNNTQSSGELMAAVLKKYNVGLVIGTKTRGHGTVEKVYEIKNQPDPSQKFGLFLVNNLTVREDGLSIEGNGVEPVIDVSKSGWEAQLTDYYHYAPLVNALTGLLK